MLDFFLKKFDDKHVSFDLKYYKTHSKVLLSVNIFVDGLPNSANLDIEDFQYFIQKHLI